MPLPQAMLAVLEAALEAGPLVLVVDVAQWVDSLLALIAALRDLPRARLGLVFAVLANPPRTELDELRRHLGHAVPGAMLSIGPLDATALRELAVWALPTYDAVALERVSRRVASDSAGLPILAVELLSAVAQGLASRYGGRRGTGRLPAPESRSPAGPLGCSGIGRPVTERLLARVTGQQAPALQAALDELEWQRCLEADGQGYSFVARLARQVVTRDMLTPGQRARFLEQAGLAPGA